MKKFSLSMAKYQRVWRLLRKPTPEEFKTVSKVSAVGLLVVGALGFAISTVIKLII